MNFFVKSLLKSQLKGVPEAEAEKMIAIIEKNPALFQKIAEEIKAKTATGANQQTVAIEVMKKYETELRGVLVQ